MAECHCNFTIFDYMTSNRTEQFLSNLCFCILQVAVFAEFRRDWVEALKFYEDAYHALREVF